MVARAAAHGPSASLRTAHSPSAPAAGCSAPMRLRASLRTRLRAPRPRARARRATVWWRSPNLLCMRCLFPRLPSAVVFGLTKSLVRNVLAKTPCRAGGRDAVSAHCIGSIVLHLQPREGHMPALLLVFVPSPRTIIPSVLPVSTLAAAPGSMATLEQIDARIAELEDEEEVARMKAARNALTPLGRLPDELLLNIVQACLVISTITDSMFMHIATAVYAHLRALLIATPSLWMKVKLGSSRALIDRHIARAHPFLLEVKGDVYTEAEFQQVITLIPCVSALSLAHAFHTTDNDDDDDEEEEEEQVDPWWASVVVAALAATDISKLTALTLEDSYSLVVDLSAVAGAHLSALVLDIFVTSFPALPQLRRLVLSNTYCHVPEIHKLLAGSPRLEHVELRESGDKSISMPKLGKVDLPHLATLKISDSSSFVTLLFGTLPNPSKCLHLQLDPVDSADGILCFSTDPLASMLAQMAQFWTQLNGDNTTLPLPWITYRLMSATLSIVSEHGSDGWAREHASLDFSTSGRILRHDPLIDEIEVLCISRFFVVEDRFDLGVVKYVQRVIIDHLSIVRVEDAEPVRAWILGQLRRGRPVQSIEFQACHEPSTKPLFDELVHLQAAQSITWCGPGLGK